MKKLKHAIRATGRAMAMALPWNRSINAIDGWLHNGNYGFADLNGSPDRVPLLVDLINYVRSLNANAWQQREPFLSTGDIKTLWGEWFGFRPASFLSISSSIATGSTTSGYRVMTLINFFPPGPKPPPHHARDMFSPLGSRTPFGHKAAFSGQPVAAASTGQPKPLMAPALGSSSAPVQICRRYNVGTCPNHFSACRTAAGIKLLHACNATNGLGQHCTKYHPRILHC
jgi:hypothetical protein